MDHNGRCIVVKERIRGLILPFSVSVVLAPLLAYLTKSSVSDGIIIGIGVFLAIEVIRLSDEVFRDRDWTRRLVELTEAVSQDGRRLALLADRTESYIRDNRHLLTIERTLRSLDRGPRGNSVIADIVRESVLEVEATGVLAVQEQRLRIDVGALSSDDALYSVFVGDVSEDFFWATFAPENIAWFQTASGDLFLKAIDSALASRRITEARRLLLYRDVQELDSHAVALCVKLHEMSNHSVRILPLADYQETVRAAAHKTYRLAEDFGVYGRHYVWETAIETNGLLASGYVNYAPDVVSRYIATYEKLWSLSADYPESVLSRRVPSVPESARLGDFRALCNGR